MSRLFKNDVSFKIWEGGSQRGNVVFVAFFWFGVVFGVFRLRRFAQSSSVFTLKCIVRTCFDGFNPKKHKRSKLHRTFFDKDFAKSRQVFPRFPGPISNQYDAGAMKALLEHKLELTKVFGKLWGIST